MNLPLASDGGEAPASSPSSERHWNDAIILTCLEHAKAQWSSEETLIQVQRNLRELCDDHVNGISLLSAQQRLDVIDALGHLNRSPNLHRRELVEQSDAHVDWQIISLKPETRAKAKAMFLGLMNDASLTVSVVKRLKALDDAHHLLDAAERESLMALRHDPSIPVDDPLHGLQRLSDELTLDIGEEVMPPIVDSQERNLSDINSLAQSSRSIRNALTDLVDESRYETATRHIDRVSTRADFERCMKEDLPLLSAKSILWSDAKYDMDDVMLAGDPFLRTDIGETLASRFVA